MAASNASFGDDLALQSRALPDNSTTRHLPILDWMAGIDADRNIFESESQQSMNISGTTLAGPQDNDCLMPHAHIGTFARLTGEVARTTHFQESPSTNSPDQHHAYNDRHDSVISQEYSDGDDGWNGYNASGLDLIDTRPDAAMEATLRAGAMAQLRRGLPSPPFTSAEDYADNYGMPTVEDPAPTSQKQDRHEIMERGRLEQAGTATSKSKEKVKGFFRRLFKCGKD